MRRTEFEVNDKQFAQEVLAACEYGTLCLVSEEEPYAVPLNFVWYDEKIYFHGFKEGRKMEIVAKNPKASFSVVKPLSLLPSYFSNTSSACFASQLYISVYFVGTIKLVEELTQKVNILNALMQKLQPEGGYEFIEVSNPMYKKTVESIAVGMLIPLSISCKLRAGQNLNKERLDLLIEKLRERGKPLDLLSVQWIRKMNEKK